MKGKIFGILFCMVLLVGIASAFEFDNIGRYDEESKTFTIKNSILGIPFLQLGTVAEIHLDTPYVVHIFRGEDKKVAEFTVDNSKDYSNAFKEMEFYNIKKDMKEIEREFNYKYKKSLGFETINDYTEVCEDKLTMNGTKYKDCRKELTGTHQEEKFEWVELDTSKELPAGEITIGIFTDVLPNDKVEWVPTFFGVRIDEWASWEDYFDVGLVSWWKLDETGAGAVVDFQGNYDGLNVGTTRGATGIVGNAFAFNGVDNYVNFSDAPMLNFNSTDDFTISAWIMPNVSVGSVVNNYLPDAKGYLYWISAGTMKMYSGGVFSGGSAGVVLNEWQHVVVVVHSSTNYTYYWNGTLDASVTGGAIASGTTPLKMGGHDGTGGSPNPDTFFSGIIDEVGIWNRTLNYTEIYDLWNDRLTPTPDALPTIVLNSPVNAYNSTLPTIDFNCTISDDNGITNVSLVINGTVEQTNNSGVNNADYLFTEIITTGAGFYNWTCQAFDDTNQFNISAVRDFNYLNDLAVSLVSPVNAYNSSSSSVTFNGTASDETAVINVSLYIDGVLNETNSSGLNATYYLFTKSLSDGNHNWTYRTCDTPSCVSATTRTFTINTTPHIQFENPTYANNTNLTASYIPVNVSLTETYFANVTFNFYNGTTTSYFYSDSTRFINESFADGYYYYNVTVWTTTGRTNSTETRNITIDTTPPIQTLISPTSNTTTDSLPYNITLNVSITETHLDSCWYWTNENPANTTYTCNVFTNVTMSNDEQYTINYCANDTMGNEVCNTTSFWIHYYTYSQNENPSIVGEGNSVIFTLFVNKTNIEDTSAILTLNNTNYSDATKTESTDYTKFVKTITIPDGWGNSTGNNMTGNWTFNISGIVNDSTSDFEITIRSVEFDDCSTLGTVILNYTLYDEESKTFTHSGQSIEIYVNLTSPYNSSLYWTFAESQLDINATEVCVPNGLLNDSSYYLLDATVVYEATGYVVEFNYIDNYNLSTTAQIQNISLYDLNSSDSTSFLMQYQDENYLPVENAIIDLWRLYVGDGEYLSVENGKTDNNGQTVLHFVTEEVQYKAIVSIDGEIVYVSPDFLALCQETPCQINLQKEDDITPVIDFQTEGNLAYNLEFDDSTRNVTLTFATRDSSSSVVLLNITRWDARLNTTICEETSTSSGGTLVCNVPKTAVNTTYLVEVRENGVFVTRASFSLRPNAFDNFGYTGIILVGLLFLTLVLIAVPSGAIPTLVFGTMGLIFASMLTLFSGGSLIGFSSALMWLIIAIVIIIIKISKRNRHS